MSTASSLAQPIMENRSGVEWAAISRLRGATRKGRNRQEIEEAVITATHVDSSDPLDRAWHRCARQSRFGENERPHGVVVGAVREWLARRGVGGAFASEEIERCVCDWCRCGRQRTRIPGAADVRAVLGGEWDDL